jgi:hypothetical protein
MGHRKSPLFLMQNLTETLGTALAPLGVFNEDTNGLRLFLVLAPFAKIKGKMGGPWVSNNSC